MKVVFNSVGFTYYSNIQHVLTLFEPKNEAGILDFDLYILRSCNAIFFTAERSIDEWLEVLNWAVQSTRKIVAYVHEDSEAFEPLKNLSVDEAKIEYIPAIRGMWIVIESERQETARIYVVYHKPYYFPRHPEGYIKIHAGKKNSTIDLCSDFLRDDIGDNISELNPYINEMTVTCWVWKNTKSDFNTISAGIFEMSAFRFREN